MDEFKPLLLTLNIDADAFQFFNVLRKQHFPPERNFLDAHLMLFHQLPADEPRILADIEGIVKRLCTLKLWVSGIASIGNGVAYKIDSDLLQQMHKYLQNQWQQWLIPQDTGKLWPHITIQNKVLPTVAKTLLKELSAEFRPFEIKGTGLSLWEYLGGPWGFIKSFDFRG
jgi:hypothetical protein